MELSKETQLKLNVPLSDITRRERKYLLGLSVLGLVISKAGAIPKELSVFGVKFNSPNQEALLVIFSLVILYYLVAFGIYAISDFLSWRLAFVHQFVESWSNKQNIRSEKITLLTNKKHGVYRLADIMFYAGAVSFLRVLFEFLLPIMLGGYTFISLLFYGEIT